MANLTITIEDDLLKRARIRALQQGTSINALLREYLVGLAGSAETTEALAEILEISRRVRCGSGEGGRAWTRDEIHER